MESNKELRVMELNEKLKEYVEVLYNDEHATSTIKKYQKDIKDFLIWKESRQLEKPLVVLYKEKLQENLKPSSVNSKIAALNGFFMFLERPELKVKRLKTQRRLFLSRKQELTKKEYERLIKAAEDKGNERLALVMQTICATGIRISELKFITRESLQRGQATIRLKGKVRVILIPKTLSEKLKIYCKRRNIGKGSVFVTKGGNPLDRSNIWNDMKKLCQVANVSEDKVFPHNLRHLFAKTYYSLEKDLNRLADLLGHSSIETTRIYTMCGTGREEKRINRLGLVV